MAAALLLRGSEVSLGLGLGLDLCVLAQAGTLLKLRVAVEGRCQTAVKKELQK